MEALKDIITFLDFIVRPDINNQDLLNIIIKKVNTKMAICLPNDSFDLTDKKKYKRKLVCDLEEVDNKLYYPLDLRSALNNIYSSTKSYTHNNTSGGNLEHMITTYHVAKYFLKHTLETLRELESEYPELKENYELFSDCVLLSAIFHDIGKVAIFYKTQFDKDFQYMDNTSWGNWYDHGTYGRSIIKYLFEEYYGNHSKELDILIRNMYYTASNHHCFCMGEDGVLFAKEPLPTYMFQAWDYYPSFWLKSLRNKIAIPGYELPLVTIVVGFCDQLASYMGRTSDFITKEIVNSATALNEVIKKSLFKKTNVIKYKCFDTKKNIWIKNYKCEFKLVLFDRKQSCSMRKTV